ncbi:MAG: cyanoexosortase B system-associated protein [Cyanobacteria bacterium CRU_2_1]|nr:cyanoexosortase B system-associated protein [Cyanobacteria bacterium CRU_2_1]
MSVEALSIKATAKGHLNQLAQLTEIFCAMLSSESSQRSPLHKRLVILFVLAIATFSTIPSYVTGQWSWEKIPELSNLESLRDLQQQGLTLPGWKTIEQDVKKIGGHKWSVQRIIPETSSDVPTPQNTILVMLRPQTQDRDLPQVEWMDINGAYQWREDSQRSLKFSIQPTVSSQLVQVEARFFEDGLSNVPMRLCNGTLGQKEVVRLLVDGFGQIKDHNGAIGVTPLGSLSAFSSPLNRSAISRRLDRKPKI